MLCRDGMDAFRTKTELVFVAYKDNLFSKHILDCIHVQRGKK